MKKSQYDQSSEKRIKNNSEFNDENDKNITNQSQTDKSSDETVKNMKSVKIKKCGKCQEKFIGTEQIIQERLSQHIKTKHSIGTNLEAMEKLDVQKSTKTYRKQCEICQQLIFALSHSFFL